MSAKFRLDHLRPTPTTWCGVSAQHGERPVHSSPLQVAGFPPLVSELNQVLHQPGRLLRGYRDRLDATLATTACIGEGRMSGAASSSCRFGARVRA
jgi:hypothetical protein